MKKFILDLLFPIHCLGCSKEGEFFCPDCCQKIPLNQKPLRKNLIVAADYKNPLVRELIHQFKYNFIKDLAQPLGQIMSSRLRAVLTISENTFLIPVPLHPKRLRWRGFNQTDLLSQEISQQLNIPAINNLLIRKKYALPQVKIANARQRKQNIKDAFQINSDFIQNLKDKTIILIDDISTTGATLEQCSQALKPLKPKEIWKLVLARG